MTLAFLPFNFSPTIMKMGLKPLAYGCTLWCGFLATMVITLTNKSVKSMVYKIEYDPVKNLFVVTQPSHKLRSLTRPRESFLELKDLKMLSREQMEAYKDSYTYSDCVYFNAKTGQMYATVGRGNWYNQGLFLFLMKRREQGQTGLESFRKLGE